MAEEKPADKAKKKGSLGKYKWWMIGGGLVVLGILFVAVRSANKNTSTSASPSTAAQGGINPATGYLYGSPADIAAQQSSGGYTGAQGPAGPAGPAGPPGPAGPWQPAPMPWPNPNPAPPSVTGIQGARPPASTVLPVRARPLSGMYTVKPGDNLSKLVSEHGVTWGIGSWQQLYDMNRNVIGGNPNLIHPGQILRV
jgi:resuscitation-promoting factor RpfA